ncbi:MAG: carbamoyl-phosphate synthase large subunit [Desulfovibrionaceae bacterium]|nr:carbamoyl-phosphate synthase large subunit [Desulfovibrionaceae bacterium]
MPKLEHLRSVMVLGSGPIIIGQACEFDYSGTQGCKALKEEGCRIILLNSNPATVMTDIAFSDRTYMEPLTLESAAEIIRKERPDAILPTLGGQTALNLAMDLHRSGTLKKYSVEVIGAKPESIELAESREAFRRTMADIGLDMPQSGLASSMEEALDCLASLSFPLIIRPSYTLGGTGGGVAYNLEEFREAALRGLAASPAGQILVEESVLGWKEIELEVIRDRADNAIVICGIENFDPMGIHTGDSITVAPILTLTSREYQELCREAMAVVRAVGVDAGGCNIQFAVDPRSGRRVIIEMNPRVSRSSALASKATGFPIARVTAKLALGYRLDELKSDLTGTCACFEPAIDYVVVKVPRFNFEKFPGSEPVLGFQMRSVGETMSLGGNFREALQKALRGLETGLNGLEARRGADEEEDLSSDERLERLKKKLYLAGPERLLLLYEAMQLGLGVEEAGAITHIDPWFLWQLSLLAKEERGIVKDLAPMLKSAAHKFGPLLEEHLRLLPPDSASAAEAASLLAGSESLRLLARKLRKVKAQGFSDARLAALLSESGPESLMNGERVGALRRCLGVRPVFRGVDACAGEFAARASYFYSTYDGESGDLPPGGRPSPRPAPARPDLPRKVMILGGGPNRIGQGVEFDYCCVQACFALQEMGVNTVMVNCNPETVSTDYDTADNLYFEPVTAEDILAICEAERPDGVIVQFGGQTPLNLAEALARAGAPIIGTRPADIALAEDRQEFSALVERLGIPQPPSGMAVDEESACRIAGGIGYPVMVRPSFVLGGRAMRIIHSEADLRSYVGAKGGLALDPSSPILVDKFLEEAIEIDVDAVVDPQNITIAAIMEHIEQAGIHSGDSCCSIPTHTLDQAALERIRDYTRKLGLALGTVGLLNVQMAIHRGEVYVIEANPRASRTVPFVSKATGLNIAGLAAKVMSGLSLEEIGFTREPRPAYHSVKEAVLPFDRFPGAEIALGPEMRSTGESMGIGRSFGMAFLKAQDAAGSPIPHSGDIILTVTDSDKEPLVPLARRLQRMGFTLHATPGTRTVLLAHSIPTELVVKIGPERPNLLDLILSRKAGMIVNTISGVVSARDATAIRAAAMARKITAITTLAALSAAVEGIESGLREERQVAPLQEYYNMDGKS